MAAPETLHVRNIVLVGQDGAGKTSLAEAMLHISGQTPRMGTTHDGKSYMDYDPEEIKRKFTLGTSVAPIPYKDYKINLLDTSGHPDFIGDTLATMQAAEMAMFVIDAVAGPQVMTTKPVARSRIHAPFPLRVHQPHRPRKRQLRRYHGRLACPFWQPFGRRDHSYGCR